MAAIPGLKSIKCGECEIFYLTPDITITDDHITQRLHPHEMERAQKMGSSSRRGEFLRTRYLIHCLTGTSDNLTPDEQGVPIWPKGLCGSITHKQSIIATTIQYLSPTLGVGIDLELSEKMHLGLERKILTASESAYLDALINKFNNINRILLLTIIFSFKESIFKSIYPLGRTMFYFLDAEVYDLNLKNQTICARLTKQTSQWTPNGCQILGTFSSLCWNNKDYTITATILGA